MTNKSSTFLILQRTPRQLFLHSPRSKQCDEKNPPLLHLLQLPDLVRALPIRPQLNRRTRRRIPMIREVETIVCVVRGRHSTRTRFRASSAPCPPKRKPDNAPHAVIHSLLVLDVPRVWLPASDDLLAVARVAGSGEVLVAPRRLEVERLVSASVFKGPLCPCKHVTTSVTGKRRGIRLGWVPGGTHTR